MTMAKIERTYNIPLRKEFAKVPYFRKAKKAVTALRQFLVKHMKCEDVRIGRHLNEEIWKDGIRMPPHHVKVVAIKEDDVVKVELFGHKYEELTKAEMEKIAEEKKPKKEADKKAEAEIADLENELTKVTTKAETKESAVAEEAPEIPKAETAKAPKADAKAKPKKAPAKKSEPKKAKKD